MGKKHKKPKQTVLSYVGAGKYPVKLLQPRREQANHSYLPGLDILLDWNLQGSGI